MEAIISTICRWKRSPQRTAEESSASSLWGTTIAGCLFHVSASSRTWRKRKCLHVSDGTTGPVFCATSQPPLRKASVSNYGSSTYGKYGPVYYEATRKGRLLWIRRADGRKYPWPSYREMSVQSTAKEASGKRKRTDLKQLANHCKSYGSQRQTRGKHRKWQRKIRTEHCPCWKIRRKKMF